QAHELAERTGEITLRFPALWGLWHTVNASGELQSARDLTEQLLAIARDEGDAALLLEAHHSSWFTRFLLGELGAALVHAEATIAGWRMVEQGRSEEGLAQIRESLPTAATANPQEDSYVALLAEAARRAGHPDEGLAAVTAALTRSRAGGVYAVELWRVQGEL